MKIKKAPGDWALWLLTVRLVNWHHNNRFRRGVTHAVIRGDVATGAIENIIKAHDHVVRLLCNIHMAIAEH